MRENTGITRISVPSMKRKSFRELPILWEAVKAAFDRTMYITKWFTPMEVPGVPPTQGKGGGTMWDCHPGWDVHMSNIWSMWDSQSTVRQQQNLSLKSKPLCHRQRCKWSMKNILRKHLDSFQLFFRHLILYSIRCLTLATNWYVWENTRIKRDPVLFHLPH